MWGWCLIKSQTWSIIDCIKDATMETIFMKTFFAIFTLMIGTIFLSTAMAKTSIQKTSPTQWTCKTSATTQANCAINVCQNYCAKLSPKKLCTYISGPSVNAKKQFVYTFNCLQNIPK